MILTTENFFNLISTSLGAFLGIYGAFLVYKKQKFDQKKVEEISQLKNHINNLSYLKKTTNDVIKIFKNQLSRIKQQISEIETDKYSFHEPIYEILYDIKRIQNLESSKLVESYMFFFNDRDKNLSKYKTVFSIVDYLEEQRKSLIEMENKHHYHITSHQRRLKPLIQDLTLNLLLGLEEVEEGSKLSLFIGRTLEQLNISKVINEDKFEKQNYLSENIPKFNMILENIVFECFMNFKKFERREKILTLTRNALIVIKDIENESDNAIKNFKLYIKECKKYIRKLENRFRLLNEFEFNKINYTHQGEGFMRLFGVFYRHRLYHSDF